MEASVFERMKWLEVRGPFFMRYKKLLAFPFSHSKVIYTWNSYIKGNTGACVTLPYKDIRIRRAYNRAQMRRRRRKEQLQQYDENYRQLQEKLDKVEADSRSGRNVVNAAVNCFGDFIDKAEKIFISLEKHIEWLRLKK